MFRSNLCLYYFVNRESQDNTGKVECVYEIVSTGPFSADDRKQLIVLMIKSLELKNNSRWLENLQIEASKLGIETESPELRNYEASIRVLNYNYEDIILDKALHENLTTEARIAVCQYYGILQIFQIKLSILTVK